MSNICIELKVKGIVQGVGFRPFVYNLALEYGIHGWVNNDDKGVNILLYTNKKTCDKFLEKLKTQAPKLARIDSIDIKLLDNNKTYKSFEIIKSENSNNKSTIISPDVSICDDCINDINDEKNFRFNYALTNCTNCGPRYSIIKTVPYDRCNTSMAEFELCEECKKEYEDPKNRRYHAQPVACQKCGPQIKLYDNQKNEILKVLETFQIENNFLYTYTGMIHVGMGPTHLVNFLGQCNIPPPSEPFIRKHAAKVGKAITAEVEEKQTSDTVSRTLFSKYSMTINHSRYPHNEILKIATGGIKI